MLDLRLKEGHSDLYFVDFFFFFFLNRLKNGAARGYLCPTGHFLKYKIKHFFYVKVDPFWDKRFMEI